MTAYNTREAIAKLGDRSGISGGIITLNSSLVWEKAILTDVTQYLENAARAILALYGVTVVSISYRLAPRFKFPTAPNDLGDNLQWLSSLENAHSLGADLSSRLVVGGVSAGANLVAVAAQKWASERLSPSMTGVWLATPYLLEEQLVPVKYVDSWLFRSQNSEALNVKKNAIDYIKVAYEPDVLSLDFSPFNDKDAHQGLPPVYFQVCGQDPLRDDALIYEKVLQENWVKTRLDMYPGVPHCHWDIFITLNSSRQAQVDVIRGLGWLLKKEEPLDEDRWKVLNEVKSR